MPRPLPERAASDALQPLLVRIRAQFPGAAVGLARCEGLARVVDWQDVPYGAEYLIAWRVSQATTAPNAAMR